MAAGDLSQYRHIANLTPTTSWQKITWGAEDKDEIVLSPDVDGNIILPAGRFLCLYQAGYRQSGSFQVMTMEIGAYKDDVFIPGSIGGGYEHFDTQHDAQWARGACVIESDGTNELSIQFKRDAGGGLIALESTRTFLDIIEIDSTLALSHYSNTSDTTAITSDVWATVALDTSGVETDSGTISRSGSIITLAANTRYLVAYGDSWDNQGFYGLLTRLYKNAAHVHGSMGHDMSLDGAGRYCRPSNICLIETGVTSESLTIEAKFSGDPSPITSGNRQAGDGGIFICELPSTVETFRAFGREQTGLDGELTLDIAYDVQQSDSVFASRVTDNQVSINKNCTALLMADVNLSRGQPSVADVMKEGNFVINGVESSHGTNGQYNRGNNTGQGWYDLESSGNPAGAFSLVSGDTVELTVNKNWDSGWGSAPGLRLDGTYPSGFAAVNLATLGADNGSRERTLSSSFVFNDNIIRSVSEKLIIERAYRDEIAFSLIGEFIQTHTQIWRGEKVGIVDNKQRSITNQPTQQNAIDLNQTVTRAIIRNRNLSDNIDPIDTVIQEGGEPAGQFFNILRDQFEFSDSTVIESQLFYLRELIDNLDLSDNIDKLKIGYYFVWLVDQIDINDQVNKGQSSLFTRLIADEISLTDAVGRQVEIFNLIVNGFTFNDEGISVIGKECCRRMLDPVIIEDNLTMDAIRRYAIMLSDYLDMQDAAELGWSIWRVFSDNAGMSDNISKDQRFSINKLLSDAVGMDDRINRIADYERVVADIIIAYDLLSVRKNRFFERIITDRVSAEDSFLKVTALLLARKITDSYNITDEIMPIIEQSPIPGYLSNMWKIQMDVTTEKIKMCVSKPNNRAIS